MSRKKESDDSVIYEIRNVVNNKIYIGSAVNFRKRKNIHLHRLRKGDHHSSHLQRSYNKHGEDKFIFNILLRCPVEYLLKVEQWFLDTQNPDYNSSKSSQTVLGSKRTPEQNKRRSDAQKGKKLKPETIEKIRKINLGSKRSDDVKERMRETSKKNKMVYQYSLNGNFIAEYRSMREASRQLGIDNKNIQRCIRGEYKQTKGFIFLSQKGLSEDELRSRTDHQNKEKAVQQYDLDGNFIAAFSSIAEASRATGVNGRKICACCKGGINSVNGFKWKYKV
jgi:group I intron endonuclease